MFNSRKSKLVFASILIALGLVTSAYSANITGQLGGQDSSGNYNFTIEDNVLKPSDGTGVEVVTEAQTTSDTLTVTETGKRTAFTGTVNSTFTLPACTSSYIGIEYSFVSGVNKTFYVDVDSSDTIKWPATGTPMAAGDKLQSPGNTGDSVTLTCISANTWFPTSMFGTFTDGN